MFQDGSDRWLTCSPTFVKMRTTAYDQYLKTLVRAPQPTGTNHDSLRTYASTTLLYCSRVLHPQPITPKSTFNCEAALDQYNRWRYSIKMQQLPSTNSQHQSCDPKPGHAPGNCLNRPSHSQLYPFPSKRFHVLLNSLFKVLCNFPSQYLFAIGLTVILSLR